jgi:hypothetical protein
MRVTQQAVMLGDEIGELLAAFGREQIHRYDGRRLQRDLAGPFVAQLGENGPGDFGLRRKTVQMRADRGDAARVGRRHAEIEARFDVGRVPMRLAVLHRRGQRAEERAVHVRITRPDMALVEMGVDVDRAGPHHRRFEVGPQIDGGGPGGEDIGDLAVLDHQIACGQIAVVEQGGGVAQRVAGGLGRREKRRQLNSPA